MGYQVCRITKNRAGKASKSCYNGVPQPYVWKGECSFWVCTVTVQKHVSLGGFYSG